MLEKATYCVRYFWRRGEFLFIHNEISIDCPIVLRNAFIEYHQSYRNLRNIVERKTDVEAVREKEYPHRKGKIAFQNICEDYTIIGRFKNGFEF